MVTGVELAVFDANFHPVLRANPAHQLERHLRELQALGISRALAVDLPHQNVHLSSHEYVELVSSVSGFTPVPALRAEHPAELLVEFSHLVEAGVRMVKIHPRRLGLSYESEELKQLIAGARDSSTGVLLCTYPYKRTAAPGECLHLPTLLDRLVPTTGLPPMILMHGGGPQLLEVCEWARHQSNVLVDLSFTMTQLASSSVGLDIQNALERFEERLVLGSDAPYEDLQSFVRLRDYFLGSVDHRTRELVASRNLERFVAQQAH